MGLNYNNSVDQDLMPNQASVGSAYSAPMDSAVEIRRKGVITRLDLSGNLLTASRDYTFEPTDWVPGDTVFVQLPAHAGAGLSVTVHDLAGNPIASWQPLSPNGGMFVFGASTLAADDFGAVLPGGGGSSSSLPPGAIDVVQSQTTPGLAVGEQLLFEFALTDDFLYSLEFTVQAAGPGSAPDPKDAAIWTGTAILPGGLFGCYQDAGTITQLIPGFEPMTPPLTSGNGTTWTANVAITGALGSQTLTVTFTDGTSEEQVAVSVRMQGLSVKQT